MDDRAIGVFDSGLGGLTAVKELQKILPFEKIVYFGDTARVPYGSHDSETIIEFAKQDLRFLMSKNIKAVLIACGTVSSTAMPTLQKMTNLPIVGVVAPAAKTAASLTSNGRILVLATAATTASHSYKKELIKINSEISVSEKACPLFVPLVENGYIGKDNPVVKMVIEDYLSEEKNFDADTVILGCTHYPIIREQIAEYLGNVNVVEAGKEAARSMLKLLKDYNLECGEKIQHEPEFYVSENTQSFMDISNRFMGYAHRRNVEKINIDRYQ